MYVGGVGRNLCNESVQDILFLFFFLYCNAQQKFLSRKNLELAGQMEQKLNAPRREMVSIDLRRKTSVTNAILLYFCKPLIYPRRSMCLL